MAFVYGWLYIIITKPPDHWFADAPRYWAATGAWLAGQDPWQVTYHRVQFAGGHRRCH